ncbi:MAG: TolC family protein, partial [Neisseriaceae bacterium]|nr:TolC family protein [Neisseriaceae bacterium]
PTGVQPSDIVYRRPDLLARQKNIASLVAKTQAARADLFPKFYINFGFLDGKIGINSLAKSSFSGPLFDVGVNLPIFTAGKIRANIKANEAILQKALYDYDDALLGALKEVDTAYRWRVAYEKNTQHLTKTENILLKRSNDSSKLFRYGEITYEKIPLNYLDYLKAREETIRQKLNSARATILLYQALGGGWKKETQNVNQETTSK